MEATVLFLDPEKTNQNIFANKSSEELFTLAKSALTSGDPERYWAIKEELQSRIFMKSIQETMAKGGVAPPPPQEEASQEGESESEDDPEAKKLAEGKHDEETGTEEKEELSVPAPEAEKSLIVKEMQKAILTKPEGEKGKKQKMAKPNATAKQGLKKNGTGKNYQYDKKPGAKKPAAKAAPAATEAPSGDARPAAELNPEHLAHTLRTTTGALKKLAETKTQEQFSAYFRIKGAEFAKKHKVPSGYWEELYRQLKKSAPKEEVSHWIRKGGKNVRTDTFTLNPKAYHHRSELHATTKSLAAAGVNTMPKLAKFLAKSYDLSIGEAEKAAVDLHKALVADGALKQT